MSIAGIKARRMTYCVAALYHFTRLTDYEQLKAPLQDMCELLGVKGTLLLAYEGINGTVAGTDTAIAQLLNFLRADIRLAGLEHKESRSEEMPFYRMKTRLKREIVTMGVEGVDPNEVVGTYVDPKDWNALITDPDVILIDTRNDYEVEIGTFKGALNPDTQTFREFPQWVEDNRKNLKKPKVAMFCTGGIRCEKASSFMKQNGFDDVYHLKGGILKYLETQAEEESLWEGDCFVFDQRVAVKHGLEESDYDQCYACRYPITEADKQSPLYVKGVACHRCHDKMSDEQRARFAERQKQIALAKERGEAHIGAQGSIVTAILYSFRRCPYAMRGRMGLKASGLTYEHREIILRDKPEDMLKVSPKGTVPVFIKEDGTVIDESLDLLIWALTQKDPMGWLDCDRDAADALIAANDTDFKHHLDRYKYASRYSDEAKRGDIDMGHRSDAEIHIQNLEDRLAANPYLLGEKQSLADIAIFPFIRQFSNVERDWWADAPYPKTRNWLTRHIESDLFTDIMRKHPLWKTA